MKNIETDQNAMTVCDNVHGNCMKRVNKMHQNYMKMLEKIICSELASRMKQIPSRWWAINLAAVWPMVLLGHLKPTGEEAWNLPSKKQS